MDAERARALGVSVIVPARDAAETIEATLQALGEQTGAPPFEVIVVDSGSSDATPVLAAMAGARVLHNPNGEPAGSRNLGAASAYGVILAFTDADCAPDPGWLAAGVTALADAGLVQGAVTPAGPCGPYDRTVVVAAEHGLYETASLFVTRDVFDRVGGFAPVPGLGIGTGQPFGEDAWFAWRARRAGVPTAFAPEASVRHAVFPRDALGWIGERTRSRHFPALVALIPELRGAFLHRRWFLSPVTLRFDLAVLGVLLAAVPPPAAARHSRRPATAFRRLAGGALAAPYARDVLGETRAQGAPLTHPIARLAADAVTFTGLLRGSLKSRAPVL